MNNSDPIFSAVYDGVKRGINVCIEHECFGSAVILIYSGIDTMAFLAMPVAQTDVARDDFIKWCDKYIRFAGREQLSGLELYSARCAMLHNYGVESRLTRNGRSRRIGYMDRSIPEIRYSRTTDPTFALLSIEVLAKAFFDGIDRFLVDLFANPERSTVVEERLKQLVVSSPANDNNSSNG